MRNYFLQNKGFYALLLTWTFVGAVVPVAAFAVIPLTVLLWWRARMYDKIFIGFWFILILSDNLDFPLGFAKQVKNLYILMLGAIVFFDRRNMFPLSGIFKYFIPYLIVGFTALYASETLPVGLQKGLSYFLLIFSVPSLILYIYRERGQEFLRELVYFGFAVIIFSILLRYYSYDFAYSHGGRLHGIFGNPNGLGIFSVVVFLLFHTTNNLFPGLYRRWFIIIFNLVVLYAIYRTGSRNALLGSLLMLFFSRFYKLSPYVGFMVFLITAVSFELISSNFTTIVRGLGLEETFRVDTFEQGSGRYVAWAFAWENIQDYYFLGRGFSYDEFLMRSNYHYLSKLGHEGGVHNTYLIIWLNAGLIGVVLFFRSVLLLFIKGGKKTPLAFPVLFTVLFSISFEPWLAASLNPYTIVFFIIVTLLFEDEIIPKPIDEQEPEEIQEVA
jgi:hypothetical protein